MGCGRSGRGGGGLGSGGFERRIEVFVKIRQENWGSGLGVRVDVIEEVKI